MTKREQLIAAATRLFAQQGYHGTGIDQIALEAGVTKKTMYHHFRSKDELILAVLQEYDQRFRDNFMRVVEKISDDPKQRLLGIFDLAERWFADHKFFGCMFINAIGEYSERDTPLRNLCMEFKSLMRSYIEQLAQQAGVPDSASLASAFSLLFEGATVTAQVSGATSSAKEARRAAEILLNAALQEREAAEAKVQA